MKKDHLPPQVEVKEVEQVTFPAQETIDQVNHIIGQKTKLPPHYCFPRQNKISALLSMLHEADPTTGEADPPDMPRLEQQVKTCLLAGVLFLIILEI